MSTTDATAPMDALSLLLRLIMQMQTAAYVNGAQGLNCNLKYNLYSITYKCSAILQEKS